MINKRVPLTSDEEWHQIILATRSSGLSDFEYCRNNNILSNTFYRALAPPIIAVTSIPSLMMKCFYTVNLQLFQENAPSYKAEGVFSHQRSFPLLYFLFVSKAVLALSAFTIIPPN